VETWRKNDRLKAFLTYLSLFGVLILKLAEFWLIERFIHWCLNKPVSNSGEFWDIVTLTLIIAPFIFINTRQKKTLKEAEDQYKVLAEDSLVGIYSYSENKLTYVNNRFLEILGYARDEVVNLDFQHLVVDEDHHLIYQSIEEKLSGKCKSSVIQLRGIRKDGSIIVVELYGTITSRKGKPVIIGSLLDISERKNNENILSELAFHDLLTGLPNRRFLENRLDELIKAGTPTAVLFMDLDGFKHVNDSLGHEAGDTLLRIIAGRLVDCAGKDAIVSRFAGDEFIILLPIADKGAIFETAENIINVVNKPITLFSKQLSISTSMGITFYPEHGDETRVLIRYADKSMYDAKVKGKNTYMILEHI
jgi:diguanylate cyclase (GGDEF)-like protein/PAS domain S-box-containing protein